MNQKFPKTEKLKRKKLIDQLFEKAKSVKAFPLILVYLEAELPEQVPIQAGVSVPKRNHKLAVTRNRIKRFMREAYRTQKNDFERNGLTFAFMFIYVGRDIPALNDVEKAMAKLVRKFNQAEDLKG